MNQYEIVTERTEILGEGPTWDSRNQTVYWIDIKGMHFSSLRLGGKNIETLKTKGMISSLVPSRSGKLYATIGHGYYRINPTNGDEELLGEVEKDISSNRFNDGKVDPFGNYWAGTMDMNEKSPAGALYVYTHEGDLKKVLNHFTISNGLSWNYEKKKFYHIDTPTRKVMVYDFDENCHLTNGKVAVDMGHEDGFPDGMNMDSKGMLWVCHWAGHQVSQWNPDTGKKLQSIKLPATNVTSCVFGGKDLDQLFVSSAKLTDAQAPNVSDMGGSVFRLKADVSGVETYKFKD